MMDDFGRRPNFSSSSPSSSSSYVLLEPKLRVSKAPSKRLSWRSLSTEDLTEEEKENCPDSTGRSTDLTEEEKENCPDSTGRSTDLTEEEKENCPDSTGRSTDSKHMPSTNGEVTVEIAGKTGGHVTFGDVAKAARAASLTEVQEGELKPLLDYDNIKLCYVEDDKSRDRTSSKVRATRLWQRAIAKTRILKDPWEKFNLQEHRAENVLRHRYNAAAGTWVTDHVVVKMDSEPFGNGAMRECFRLKKISTFAKPRSRTLSTSSDEAELSAIDDPSLWSGSAKNYVAKRYIEPVPRRVYYDDVKLQMDAKLWGEEYNRYSPPKPVDIFQMSLLEFPSRPDKPLYHLEHFIEGDYVKYNSNSGYINDKNLRRTPQAFSHFSFERSEHQLIVVDVQGVGDLYTDPQIHTVTGSDYGDGNLGTRGMALFFHSHACNRICRSLNLTPFDLSSVEMDDQKTLVANQKNCVTMLRGMETPLRLSSTSDDGYFDLPSPIARFRSLSGSDAFSDGSSASEQKKSENGDKANLRLRFDSSICEEDEMGVCNNFLKPANLNHRGSSVAVEASLLTQLREKQGTKPSQSILGQMHLDLAKYHDQGRFSEDTGRDEIDFGALLFHLEKAAECLQLGAIMTLAAILLKFPSDVITNEIPQSALLRFLKGDEASGRGFELLSSAASAGDRSAMIRLGDALETGRGRPKAWKEAVYWFDKAAQMEDCDEGGQFDSMCAVPLHDLLSRQAAMLSTGGFGLEGDPSSAGDLYSAAADAAVAAMKGRLANKFYMLAEEAWALVDE